MRNRRVILVSGLRRGGTNVVWNLLQSHPEVVAPLRETGELLKASRALRRLFRAPLRAEGVGRLRAAAIDRLLFRRRMDALADPDARFFGPEQPYDPASFAAAALCLKSVDDDARHTELIRRVYPGLPVIGVTRHGHALAEGWIRRGKTAGEAGRAYRKIADAFAEADARPGGRFRLVRFEDAASDPFGVAAELFGWLGLEPDKLPVLRLKSKRVVGADGRHAAAFGAENRKSWFTPESIRDGLDPAVGERQRQRLSDADRAAFDAEAGEAMASFDYANHASPRACRRSESEKDGPAAADGQGESAETG